jgi:hypothetical protein
VTYPYPPDPRPVPPPPPVPPLPPRGFRFGAFLVQAAVYGWLLGLLLVLGGCRDEGPTGPAPATQTQVATPYGSCDEAKKAGAAPLHRGDAGWNPKLDRDGDGVACEVGR